MRLVVVGASLAGLRAVQGAREAGFEGVVTLVGAEEHVPYDRPPLSKEFLSSEAEPPVPSLCESRGLREDWGAELLLGEAATGLDTEGRAVLAGGRDIPYDALVIATGAAPRLLPGTGHLDGVHALRTPEDACAIRRALSAGARTVVIGAGLIGSEVASAARARGLPVTVVEALSAPLVRSVGEEAGAALSALHTGNGTDLRCNVSVTAVEGRGRVERVHLSDGSTVAADLVVVGIGASPDTAWLGESGIAVDDGVVCDATLATAVSGVYAAGDVASWYNPLFERRMRLEHWTNAAEQGLLAGRNAADPAGASPLVSVPYFWSEWYGTRLQFAGVPAGDRTVVAGDVAAGRFAVLYGRRDRLMGVLAVGRRSLAVRFRRLIRRRASWDEALAALPASPALERAPHAG